MSGEKRPRGQEPPPDRTAPHLPHRTAGSSGGGTLRTRQDMGRRVSAGQGCGRSHATCGGQVSSQLAPAWHETKQAACPLKLPTLVTVRWTVALLANAGLGFELATAAAASSSAWLMHVVPAALQAPATAPLLEVGLTPPLWCLGRWHAPLPCRCPSAACCQHAPRHPDMSG